MTERRAILEVTPLALVDLLQLPPGAEITDVRVDAQRGGIIEIFVRGAGWDARPGAHIVRTPMRPFKQADGSFKIDWEFVAIQEPGFYNCSATNDLDVGVLVSEKVETAGGIVIPPLGTGPTLSNVAPSAPTPTSLFAEEDLPPVEPEAKPFLSMYVHFERPEDVEDFGRLIGFPVSMKTRVLPFPPDDLFADRGPGALAALKPEDS